MGSNALNYDVTEVFDKYKKKKISNNIFINKLLRISKLDKNYNHYKNQLRFNNNDELSFDYNKNLEEFRTYLEQDNQYYKHSMRIDNCNEYSTFAECQDCHSLHYIGSKNCKSRFCSVCATKRSLIYIRRYEELFNSLEEQGYQFYFGTFTLKSMFDFEDMLNRFNKTWKKFREKYPIYFDNFDGGVMSREFTWSKEYGWHVHIHTILVSKKKITGKVLKIFNKQMSDKWLQKTGDSSVTQIKPIKKKLGKDGNLIRAELFETFKYITDIKKIADLPDQQFKEVFDKLKNRRMISNFGLFYNITKLIDEQVEKELEESSYNKILESVCAACGCTEFEVIDMLTLSVEQKVYKLKPRD